MKFDAIVVGGGVAGLTAAAYLSKAGYNTLLCEKQDHFGGLVNTFERDGFHFDGGIRATEDSGILFPMLKQLGIELEFVRNKISLGLEDRIIPIRSEADVRAYRDMLNAFYPENTTDIEAIMAQIQRVMKLMKVQYGIKNPAFLDMQADRDYMMKEIFPWMFKYLFTFRKIEKLNTPVEDFLRQFTDNQALLDIITQHFFKATPAFFALGYLKLYLEYFYPLGGTGVLIEALTDFITVHGGTLRSGTAITSLNPAGKTVTDSNGQTYEYDTLIWAADLKALYNGLDLADLPDGKTKQTILDRKTEVADKKGNDSILTLFVAADLDPTYFSGIASEHFFYTPSRKGETAAGPLPIGKDKETVWRWLADFFALTTYEIAIPVLRDPSMAPEDQTGLVISMLFDYRLTKYIRDSGWYDEFKSYTEEQILQTLTNSVYPELADKVLFKFSSTPLTIEQISGNTEGAITGWAFTNDPIPAEDGLPKIFSASKTPIPDVFQAGQWTYSPSGLPISILTGKLSADRAIKALGKKQGR
jgi:phytoene dehydrogenase-like protein